MGFLRIINMKYILYTYRYLFGGLMLIAAFVNGILRFFGEWYPFFGALMLQLWFGQAVFAYLRRGRVAIGPGGLSKDADPVGRAALAGVSFFVYMLGFLLEFGSA